MLPLLPAFALGVGGALLVVADGAVLAAPLLAGCFPRLNNGRLGSLSSLADVDPTSGAAAAEPEGGPVLPLDWLVVDAAGADGWGALSVGGSGSSSPGRGALPG